MKEDVMNRYDELRDEDVIDLGAATTETRGSIDGHNPDLPVGTRVPAGLSND
jgi:hypothetical protein